MTTVVLDTNALMMPVECDVRLFEAVDALVADAEYVTPAAVLAELEKLREGAGAEAKAAAVGRDLAERARVVETDESYADDAVVELASGGFDGYVVTNDGPLRERLADRAVRVICLRGGNTLAVTAQ
ncbi:PIN domain-containing protein [Halorarum halobium]|uniref:PIN domain-containing protein n=1 Tax=Halorarum halobium TaxID=3075121 RepID=UPI0028AEB026|nr:twitching motility protein PilT [Halobaculum sp. XH14]